jgi:hypothetical protein
MTFDSLSERAQEKSSHWPSARRSSLPAASRALAWLATSALAHAGALAAPATVTVDFGQAQGPLPRIERYNNFHTTSVFASQRPLDVAKLNQLGMHGKVYRVWLNSPNEASVPPCLEDVSSPPAPSKPCTLNPPFGKYLSDAEQAADKVLGNLRIDGAPSFMTSGGPDAAVPLIERMLLAIKRAHPKFAYVEAWNEPDAPGTVHQAATVYPWYTAVYRAVNNVNATLGATVQNYMPMQIGGPALYYFNRPWFEAFFDGYAADTNPAKRLDFVSYHAYIERSATGAAVFYKASPRLVENQRAELEAIMKARGISTRIPSYVTETGMYPSSVCDRCDVSDYLRSAAGVASLHYWFANQPGTYPFNWLMRQREGANGGSGLKDQFVTENPIGSYRTWKAFNPLPADFTPFGNMLHMKSKLKDVRVSAQSDSLSATGIGVYALASHDATGAAMMIWNYQGCSGGSTCPSDAFPPYQTTLNVSNLPPSVRNRPVTERLFRIDQATSNFFIDTTRANLQEVGTRTFTAGRDYTNALDLAPNAIHLVILEPTKPPSKDACKDGGWRNYVDDQWQDFKNQGACASWAARHL